MNITSILGIVISFVGICIASSMAIGSEPAQEIHLSNGTSVGTTIYVNDDNIDGPWDGTIEHPYQHIHDAIDAASDGDTVFVYSGMYYENVIVDKSLTLVGMNSNSTIIDGSYNGSVIHIVKDHVIISNLTIRGSGGYTGDAGVKLDSDNGLIKNCIFYGSKTGIFFDKSSFSEVNNCTFHMNGGGIFLKTSDNNIINGCSLSHNAIGINLEHSINNKICSSYLHTNGIACLFEDSSDIEMFHCNISDNSVNIGGVFITNCSDVTINNCIIRHNGAGVSIFSSKRISVISCNLYLNTHFAISLRTPSYDVIVSKCNIKYNFRFGIYVSDNNFCNIMSNNIYKNNLFGLHSKNSVCNAKYNWWGSKFGPSCTEFGVADRVMGIPGQMKIFPWFTKPLEDIGTDWKDNEPYMKDKISELAERKINLPGCDSDGDGAPNWWEEKWGYNPFVWDDHAHLDPDNDGLSNIEECYTDKYDSNPFHKDIFLEIDWMKSPYPDTLNKPPADLIEGVISSFDEHNIALHVDLGNLDGGEEIPIVSASNFSFAKLRDIYWDYFLHNNLNNPRKGIFHYGLICNHGPDINFPFFGWGQFDSFLVSAQWLKEKNPLFAREELIVGAMVHQLGHTLGLLDDKYGGIDNIGTLNLFSLQWWKYHNYKSCMNYHYKFRILTFSDGTHGYGDFDDWDNLDYSFFKNSHFEWPKSR